MMQRYGSISFSHISRGNLGVWGELVNEQGNYGEGSPGSGKFIRIKKGIDRRIGMNGGSVMRK
jgi:hypothetical protein